MPDKLVCKKLVPLVHDENITYAPIKRIVKPPRICHVGPRIVKSENNKEMHTRALPKSDKRSSRQVIARESMEMKIRTLSRENTTKPSKRPVTAEYRVGIKQEKHQISKRRISVANIDVNEIDSFVNPEFSRPSYSRSRRSSISFGDTHERRSSAGTTGFATMYLEGESKLIQIMETMKKYSDQEVIPKKDKGRRMSSVSFKRPHSGKARPRSSSIIKQKKSLTPASLKDFKSVTHKYNEKKGDPKVSAAILEVSAIQIQIVLGLIIRIQRFVRRIKLHRDLALFRDSIRIVQRQFRAYRCRVKYLDILDAKRRKKSSMKAKHDHTRVDDLASILGNGNYEAGNTRDSESLNFCRARSIRITMIRQGFFSVESEVSQEWETYGELLESSEIFNSKEPFDLLVERYTESLDAVPEIHAGRCKGDGKLAIIKTNVGFFLPRYSLKSLISTRLALDRLM
jgi:hypothetical protein